MDLNEIVACEICEAITITQPKKRKYLIENRQNYGLSFCKNGKITYIYEGKQYISDPTHAVFHPQGATYMLVCCEPGDFPIINFRSSTALPSNFIQIELNEPVSVYLSLYEKLQALYFQQNRKAMGMSVFYEIISLLADQPEKRGNAILYPATQRIYRDFADAGLSVAALAKEAHVSECYLRKLFKQEFGLTPRQFVNKVRIDHARMLLCENRFSISEIAAQCGFSSVYYFCKAFRAATGFTAGQYAKNNSLKL